MEELQNYGVVGILILLLFRDVVRPLVTTATRKKHSASGLPPQCDYDLKTAEKLEERVEQLYLRVCVKEDVLNLLALMREELAHLTAAIQSMKDSTHR